MNISEMSNVKKSVLLAKLNDNWRVLDAWSFGRAWQVRDAQTDEKLFTINLVQDGSSLYDPANMALAWQVLNLAWEMSGTRTNWHGGFFMWFDDMELYRRSPTEAQTAWLDKILELAIDAGMIE